MNRTTVRRRVRLAARNARAGLAAHRVVAGRTTDPLICGLAGAGKDSPTTERDSADPSITWED
jgi:hypothetical protein